MSGGVRQRFKEKLSFRQRLCRNDQKTTYVILNKVKNPHSVLSVAKNPSSFTMFRTSLRLLPQNDIAAPVAGHSSPVALRKGNRWQLPMDA